MFHKKFIIAGLPVQAASIPTTNWRPFVSHEKQDCAVAIRQVNTPFPVSQAPVLSSHDELIVRRMPDGGWLFESPPHLAPVQALLTADKTHIAYHLPQCKNRQEQQMKLNHMLRTAFECRFCQDGIVSLHSACVEGEDWAVAFTGHSGLGKSTRANAWVTGVGARLLSGDRPAVRLNGQGGLAYGVPWDGKEQIFRSVCKPLKCILEVRRSPENYIRRLSAGQARELIMQQTFVPMWDTEAAVMAMGNARRLVRQVPVYRVFCGPTPEDARAIYDILFRHPEKIREEAKDMKIKEGFVLRNVVDEYIVMPTGDNIATFDGAVALNEVSAFIYRQLQYPVSREDLLSAILNEYDIDEDTAARDLDKFLSQFDAMGLLEQ